MGPAQFGPRNEVAEQCGERAEQLVLVVAGARQCQAPLEVGGSLTAHAALRHARHEAALQPDRDFPAISRRSRGAAGELIECVGEAIQRFLRSEFKFGTQDGVAVWVQGSEGPNNRTSQGADVIAWARAAGAYAGITLEGTSVAFDESENRAYYGKLYSPEEIVVRFAAVNQQADPLRASLMTK